MKKIFVTFGNERFVNSKERLKRQVKDFEYFDELHILSEADLDPSFLNNNLQFMRENRGFGYWIWKPYVIKRLMDKMNEGDLLLYLDAGSHLNIEGKKRFLEYVDIAMKHGVVAMQNEHLEIKFTKKQVLEQFPNVNPYTKQHQGHMILFIKNDKTEKLTNAWYAMSLNRSNFDDSLTYNENPHFVDHRHDQSCLSMLIKDMNLEDGMIEDETYFPNEWHKKLEYPVHARRDRF
jgi:hypothetical protein